MYKYRDNLRLFLFWGVICAVANILCTFASAFESDQGYWVGWIKKLMEEGFAGFDGNYPPLYVFWLWVVAQVYSLFDMAVDKNLFLKFTCLWPVFFAHLFLVDWVCRLESGSAFKRPYLGTGGFVSVGDCSHGDLLHQSSSPYLPCIHVLRTRLVDQVPDDCFPARFWRLVYP